MTWLITCKGREITTETRDFCSFYFFPVFPVLQCLSMSFNVLSFYFTDKRARGVLESLHVLVNSFHSSHHVVSKWQKDNRFLCFPSFLPNMISWSASIVSEKFFSRHKTVFTLRRIVIDRHQKKNNCLTRLLQLWSIHVDMNLTCLLRDDFWV